MKLFHWLAVLIWAGTAAVAVAACGTRPPVNNWNTQSGDQRVSGDYLQSLLAGKKVKFKSVGTEHYRADGTYAFRFEGQTSRAPGYRFYPDGIRCIDYPQQPRYDLYVVRDQQLVLINWVGGRYPARVTR